MATSLSVAVPLLREALAVAATAELLGLAQHMAQAVVAVGGDARLVGELGRRRV